MLTGALQGAQNWIERREIEILSRSCFTESQIKHVSPGFYAQCETIQ